MSLSSSFSPLPVSPLRYTLSDLFYVLHRWFKEPPNAGLSTINAQCESVFEGKPSWRGPRENKRCVVIAQGFYEWLQKGKEKIPHFVKRKDGKLMAFGAFLYSLPVFFCTDRRRLQPGYGTTATTKAPSSPSRPTRS